jgi:hypothetical protein
MTISMRSGEFRAPGRLAFNQPVNGFRGVFGLLPNRHRHCRLAAAADDDFNALRRVPGKACARLTAGERISRSRRIAAESPSTLPRRKRGHVVLVVKTTKDDLDRRATLEPARPSTPASPRDQAIR